MEQTFFSHSFSPVAFYFFDTPILWYWLNYLIGYVLVLYGGIWFIGKNDNYFNKTQNGELTTLEFNNFLIFAWLGLFFGARLIYVVFYNFDFYKSHLIEIPQFWKGGMSFHGAILGIFITGQILLGKNYFKKYAFLDVISIFAPLGLMFGRIGNFINGELIGRPAQLPWSVIFPKNDLIPRHPSQLYEAFGEGLFLFFILFYIARKSLNNHSDNRPGIISAYFLIFYGFIRFLIEFFREPDPQIGYFFSIFTLGQIFCLAMILLGGILLKLRSIRIDLSQD